jgi:hypothetical protein
MNSENQTFLGGAMLTVTYAPKDGLVTSAPTEEIKVRQLPLLEYERALPLLDDEFALTALFCSRDKAWIGTLAPESYEALLAKAREVNELGFFAYSRRRLEAGVREITQMIKAGVPLDEIMAAMTRQRLAAGSRIVPQPRG